MKQNEINEFIEEMEAIGDEWEPEEVERVYGDTSLEDALTLRKSEVGTFNNIISNLFGKQK